LVQITTPVFTSSVTYIIPIVAVIWGLIDGEELVAMHYIGMLAIIIGVYIANRPKKIKKRAKTLIKKEGNKRLVRDA
jgi:drug/metabolite transporter (DMT)-like permease